MPSLPTLFIADLHLDPRRPEATETFRRFLAGEARGADALYILGDLFEAWVGDDAIRGDEPELTALRELSEAGVPVYVMHGNRDFLLGEAFAREIGATLLPEPWVTEVQGTPTVLLHGDSLCTADTEYQAFRAMVRDPQWQRGFLAQSLEERLAQARDARAQSAERGAQLDLAWMDVTPEAVTAALREAGVQWMIHGHTHRPDIHRFEFDGAPAGRFVLGDWFEQGSLLRCTPAQWTLETLPHSPAPTRGRP